VPDAVVPDPGPRTTDPGLPEEPPPFGASWRSLYAAVAVALAAAIVLLALFTRAFE